MRPLLLLDVDGPLHPWAADQPPPGYAECRFRLSWRRRQRVWLNPGHGQLCGKPFSPGNRQRCSYRSTPDTA